MNLELKKLTPDYFVAKVETINLSLIEKIGSDSSDFWTIAQTPDEISLVSNISAHPLFTVVEGPWTAFRVAGQLDFSLTGILSRCSTLLADAKISVFAVSTFDTDYFLVRKESEDAAIVAWRIGGIQVDSN
jgi:uncharacterized protein